ncbi:type II toxin-antitoxin system RelE family toxin [Solidesulfovibrio carbinolicus]|uniref:Cytotoxic translational repressor of toxin-antitoxin stability system n=1 Tax=Solidesulfovibrio carbinolicus TaxID=296842 RepID=A0A4P6HGC5_9BACT|nr:type II toxin-antitoxin system RelE/ParE family toxin [Solidesulfovibrio carbinolicus]QAZ66113.1 cytotoxic translational repressor of toxin-antitoxin stability system [Solidesulfovibrio carbinolicus]
MNTVEITPKAFKQMRNFPKSDRAAILKAFKELAHWPNCRNVKHLTQLDGYRLRIGDYRAFFTVDGNYIEITEVKRRNEHTY